MYYVDSFLSTIHKGYNNPPFLLSTYVLKHLGEAIESVSLQCDSVFCYLMRTCALGTLLPFLGKVKMKKADVNLPLRKIERIAAEALEEEEALAEHLESISLNS